MREGRDAGRRGQLRDREILGRIDARRVADDDADADRARRDVVRDLVEDPRQLRGRSRLAAIPRPTIPPKIAPRAAVERAARDHVHASHGPRCREAEVDRRTPPLLAGVRAIDGRAAGFELERGRDAVARLQPPTRKRLRVAVQVDEARRDDEPADVDRRRPLERVTNRGDAPTVDAHVASPVEPGLRIEHPPAGQHQVVRHRELLYHRRGFDHFRGIGSQCVRDRARS